MVALAKRHERKVKIDRVSSKEAIERFEYSLSKTFDYKRVEDRGQYVVCHGRVHLGNKTNIDIIIYTTDKIFISATPYLQPEKFNEVADKIVSIAQQSVEKLADLRPVTLQRASSILQFALELNIDNEYQRMIAVILADTSNEIVLREQMKALRIQGPPLDAGIPEKIKYIKEKGRDVYMENEIMNVRELRNGIVHHGNIPDKEQTREALQIAKEVLEKA